MYNQPKAEPLEMSTFFADSQASRPIIEGTVPRSGRAVGAPDAVVRDTSAATQGAQGGSDTTEVRIVRGLTTPEQIRAMSIPMKVTRQVLDRGRERYDIYCSPCHGVAGDGDGMIVKRGYKQPTSYHDPRLRNERAGYFFDVMTRGFGQMPDYAAQVSPKDRWAIVAYIRALQLSQHASVGDLTPDERGRLDRGETVPAEEPAPGHAPAAEGAPQHD
jgi:hypothetical protein